MDRCTCALFLGVALLARPAAQAGQPVPVQLETDASHATAIVEVAPGVSVEVLHWGGTGPPLVLLANFQNSAHVFDEFAPALRRSNRVIGVTRRGTGWSSAPPDGYGTRRLAEDVLAVMDRLNMRRAMIAGHGAAGYELRWLGTHHPERVQALIFLDAAYQRTDTLAREIMTQVRAASGDAVQRVGWRRWFVDTMFGGVVPSNVEMQLCCEAVGIAESSRQQRGAALVEGIDDTGFAALGVPSFALYASLPRTASQHPIYGVLPPAARAVWDRRYPELLAAQAADIAVYGRTAEFGRMERLLQAHHYVFLSQPADTYARLMTFIQRFVPPPQ